jgi:hypothetical protein
VKVVVGCGEGAPDGGAVDLDAGPCTNLDFFCIPSCGSSDTVAPICVAGRFRCPTGSVTADSCTTCPAVPHGCCKQDGTLTTASCVAGQWICPPGAVSFGTGSCKPPQVCATLLPCAPGQLCKVPDLSCATTAVPGTCEPVATSCPSGGPPACGCDGRVYGNTCLASLAGTDLSLAAPCSPPNGTFRCGPYFCNVGSEVCRKTTTFATSLAPDSYACVQQTAACAPGCINGGPNACSLCEACPAGRKCGFTCTTSVSGARDLTCTVL